ncbi:spirocyclase AveC family protein [Nocardia sp. NPDC051756]|uniref:spirocyclase AveC family protein n=1 Tax=Nocardia sp. NPDC051756 TaxID=3154751 RepID=UPI00341869CA
MSTETDVGERRSATSQRPAKPYLWFAVVGVLSFVIGFYAWTAWIVSGDATPIPTGPDPVPGYIKFSAWFWQITSVIVIISVVSYAARRSWRERRITFDATFIIGGTLIAWQEPFMNYLRPGNQFYNSYWVNLGSWGPHLPGFMNVDNKREPLPLIFELGYGSYYLLIAVFGCQVMRWCARRWPRLSKPQLVMCCFGGFLLTEPLLDALYTTTSFYQYGHGIPELTLWSGERYQIPLTEVLASCSFFTSYSVLRYFRDADDHSIAERGIDEAGMSGLRSAISRILGVAGYIAIVSGLFMVMFNWGTIYGGPAPADMPSYMVNNVCGTETDHPCSVPNIPIPQPDLIPR